MTTALTIDVPKVQIHNDILITLSVSSFRSKEGLSVIIWRFSYNMPLFNTASSNVTNYLVFQKFQFVIVYDNINLQSFLIQINQIFTCTVDFLQTHRHPKFSGVDHTSNSKNKIKPNCMMKVFLELVFLTRFEMLRS